MPAVARLTSGRAHALSVATATSAFAAVAAAVALAARGDLGAILRPRVVPHLLLLGALGTAIPFLLLYAGASRISAIETALCLQSETLYAFLGAWLVLGHRPTLRRVASLVALTIGVSHAIGAHQLGRSVGAWLVLATPIAWQASHLFVLRRLRGLAPSALTGARYVYGGALLGMATLATAAFSADPLALPPAMLPALAVQGVGLSYLGTLAWYGAIARLDLARTTSIVVPSIPVLSLGASFVLLGETATPRQLIGLLLTAAGVLAFATAPDATAEDEPIPPGAA